MDGVTSSTYQFSRKQTTVFQKGIMPPQDIVPKVPTCNKFRFTSVGLST